MKQIQVAVTGSIGSGKSTFTDYLKEKGFPVLNADDISKDILANDKEVRKDVINEFGEESFKGNEINKKYLAENVFSDPKKLQKINSILHPRVRKKIQEIIQNNYEDEKIIFIETALVYEANIEKMFDYVVLITADENIRLDRSLKENKFTKEDFLKRNRNQIPDEEKIKRADFVFYNNNDKEELYKKADLLLLTLKSLS